MRVIDHCGGQTFPFTPNSFGPVHEIESHTAEVSRLGNYATNGTYQHFAAVTAGFEFLLSTPGSIGNCLNRS